MKAPLIIALSVGSIVVATIVTVIMLAPSHEVPAPKFVKKPATVPANVPAKPVAPKPTRQHVEEYSGGTELKTPEPIKSSDFEPRKINPDIRTVKNLRSAEAAGVMMPISGPAPADRIVGKARTLKKEGRIGEATKLLDNAIRTETNPYYRKLLENEIKSSGDQRAPADTSASF